MTGAVQVPVLIVGAGPVGLLAGLLLEQQGIDYRILERRPGLHDAPQAHAVSVRTMEIVRSIGIEADRVREVASRPEDTGAVYWVDHLAGRNLGVFRFDDDAEAAAARLAQTPTPMANVPQDRFENVLFDHLATKSNVLFSHNWRRCERTDDGSYVSTIESEAGEVQIQSKYIIASDGAGSTVRRACGIAMDGPDNLRSFMTIHFRANLREQLGGKDGLLYWIMDDAAGGVVIAHDIDSNWVFMKVMSSKESVDPIDEAKFSAALDAAIGADVPREIVSMKPWRMTAQVAESYRDGHIFLAGDAAHRFPPTGGLGMNTGMQDAHNLVWKIAMVERGNSPDLLDTYASERKPVAEANTFQSLANSKNMTEIRTLLDVDGDRRITMADIDAAMGAPDGPAAVQAAVDRQANQFIVSGLDLGFTYGSAGIVGDGPAPESRDVASEYLPSTTPGARMPHAWLTRTDGAGAQQTISTLDLVRHDAFLVLANGDADGRAVAAQLERLGMPVTVAQVQSSEGTADTLVPADEQFASVFADGPLLIVRPDGHIGARLKADPSASDLKEVASALLGLTQSHQESMA